MKVLLFFNENKKVGWARNNEAPRWIFFEEREKKKTNFFWCARSPAGLARHCVDVARSPTS